MLYRNYFLIDKNIQISVFAKTGTTFLDNLVLENKLQRGELPQPDMQFVSVREPFDRFISGFITFHKRSKFKTTRKSSKFITNAISNLDLLDAFVTCYDLVKNDWSFDGHTELSYNNLPLSYKNVEYFNFSDIGILCESLGIVVNYDNKSEYINSNLQSEKNKLLNFICSNNDLHHNIKKYLEPDIEIFQKLPISKIKA